MPLSTWWTIFLQGGFLMEVRHVLEVREQLGQLRDEARLSDCRRLGVCLCNISVLV